MRDGGTNQPAPLVYNGTMYLANTGGIMQALDARTGNLIWEHHVGADIAPRGIALYGNKLIFQSAASGPFARKQRGSSRSTRAPARPSGTSRCRTSMPRTAARSSRTAC